MFQDIVDNSKAKRHNLTAQAEHLEKSAATAADKLSLLIVDDLNDEVKQIYDTQKLIEQESQLLRQELASLNQQLVSWSGKTKELLETLKHVGDLEHYVAVLKREATALATVLSAALHESAARGQQQAVIDTTAADPTARRPCSNVGETSAAASGAVQEHAISSCQQEQQQQYSQSPSALLDINVPSESADDTPATPETQSVSTCQDTRTVSGKEAITVQQLPEHLPVSSRASR